MDSYHESSNTKLAVMMYQYYIPVFGLVGALFHSGWREGDGVDGLELVKLNPTRLISRYGDELWPQRSPDLNMCDFFL